MPKGVLDVKKPPFGGYLKMGKTTPCRLYEGSHQRFTVSTAWFMFISLPYHVRREKQKGTSCCNHSTT